jgi:hypothetical protein
MYIKLKPDLRWNKIPSTITESFVFHRLACTATIKTNNKQIKEISCFILIRVEIQPSTSRPESAETNLKSLCHQRNDICRHRLKMNPNKQGSWICKLVFHSHLGIFDQRIEMVIAIQQEDLI